MSPEEKEEWQEEIRRDLWLVVFGFFSIALLIFTGWYLSYKLSFWSRWMSILWIVISIVYSGYIFYFKFVPANIFFAFVEEGTAKIIMYMGEAKKGLIQYTGFRIDEDWNIVPRRRKRSLLGGLKFIGFWPMSYVYKYRLRWTSVRENGEAVSHEDQLDSVLLKEKIYSIRMKTVEDKNNMPLNIDILVTLKIINPYKALFIAEDYLELVLNRTRPLFREFVGGVAFSELKTKKQRAGGEVWKKLLRENLIQEFEKDWGIKIKDGGIEITDVNPVSEQYRKATTQKYLADREAERVAGETIGSVINMMAVSYGLTFEEMQKKINKSAKFQKEFREFCKETLHKKMAIDGSSYVKVDVSGAEGIEKGLLNYVAAKIRMPQGQQKQPKKTNQKKDKLSAFKDRVGKNRKGINDFTSSEDDEED